MTHSALHIESIGEGRDLIMLHGWGMNSAVFAPLQQQLSGFRVHYVDLPGFGHSQQLAGDINTWVEHLINRLPTNAIWLGWSMGGLIATQAALAYPDKVTGLITVASSPYFVANAEQSWPGIDPKVLAMFANQLDVDVKATIEHFLAIQAMGSQHAKQDIKKFKHQVLSRPLPHKAALEQGLGFLQQVDLREQLHNIEQPWLRIWGRLDGIVSRHVPPQMPIHHEAVYDVIMKQASHAPFVSHQQEFVDVLLEWLKKL
ncbi:pimeloyl-[acyl-carrier protein] methyl ester esterase [Parashewanella spongiae]|uniref:Pimeloyl-[acyl-carrier protein] methyl ester esterase n=1 Tax=Parashewanella spongiae TaxID=342950 RepID=A0A3A6UBE4_9GAMM|nr:pimeloyl-ACP methyl ester esterase BioH [Parashewanella spongiae]MCL1077173.1 pimeloyl-ACP methyl ester esterase BioH [Parashewanella spongiae]RJY19328.1 pimeloyl-[acyl-carrier protein] methyl ester esterase [Parashewanella spongiae]